MTLLRQFCAFSIGALAILLLGASAVAAPRDGAQRATPPGPAPSATKPHVDDLDLDAGKTPQQMFSGACVVCHQSPQGLAKGRSAGQLGSFLRQHYTAGTSQANALAGFLTSGGLDRGTPTPVRASPGDKPADKPAEPVATSRKPKPDETRGRPQPDVAATQPGRRVIRNEDGTTQPVEGLVVLPPGTSEVPDDDAKPAERRRETRPEPAPGRQRQPRPSDIKPAGVKPAEIKPAETKPAETKPAEQAKPVEMAKPAEPESAPAPVQAEAPKSPRDPAAAHSSLTEERPKPALPDVQEIPL